MNMLWIDDLRNPNDFINTAMYSSVTWKDTFEKGHTEVEYDLYDVIHLDNDLSDENDRQGKHIFDYIEELLYFGKIKKLKKIVIHSDNSSAVRYMMGAKAILNDKYGVEVSQMIFKSR